MKLWVFFVSGIGRFYDNIKMMLGWRINPYMWISWTILTPIYCLVKFPLLFLAFLFGSSTLM